MAEVYNLQLSDGLQYPYKINFSKRAKYIRIKLSQRGDLSVTMPERSKAEHAHDFIHSKKSWIEKHLVKVRVSNTQSIPTNLDLKLLNENWNITYFEKESTNVGNLEVFEKDDHQLEILGNINQLNNIELISKTLSHWCKKKSKVIFNKMLQEAAELHGFHYHRLSIRAQKTRWGSCSNQKNINLNCKLLFMPEEVVRYVMIHELCHTIEMNHSKRFWGLVEECDPEYKNHKKTLKSLGSSILI